MATMREAALGDLKVLIDTAKSAWAYADDKKDNLGVDLDKLNAEAVSQISNCTNKDEVYEVLRGVVAGLKDGHGSLRRSDKAGSETGRIKGKLYDTREGLVYERQLVLQWNGRDVQEELESRAKQVYASTPGMGRRLAIQRLENGPLNQTVRVRLKNANGSEEERVLRYEPDSEAAPPPLEVRWLSKEIAYLAIRTFDVRRSGWAVKTNGPLNASGLPASAVEAVQRKISDAFSKCVGAKALILDLRGNMGGTDSIGSHAALHLLPGDFSYFNLQTRYSPELKRLSSFTNSPETGWSQLGPGWKPTRPPSVKPFEGPVWILLDELCFSTTDNLLACLRDLLPGERARFLGRPSGGGTGAPRRLVTLPFTGAELTLTVMKVYSPRGRLIEGWGTVPDRKIAWKWKDVIEGKDPDLEAALEEAQGVIQLKAEVHDRGWVVYGARSSAGDWDLSACRPDGSDARPLTRTPEFNEFSPQYSRDGRKLLYRRIPRAEVIDNNRHGEQGELVLAEADGSNPVVLGEIPWASFSSDGRQIASLSIKGIAIIDLATRQVVRTLPRKGFFQQMTWSPDGLWLIGVANSFDTGWSIARLELATGEAAAVNRVDCCTPDWFPDSRAVVFSWRPPGQSANNGYGWTQLWRAPADGSTRQLVYGEDGRHVYGGNVSPDGQYILFTGNMNEDGDPNNAGAPMGLVRLKDTPIIGGESKDLRALYPEAKSGPVLVLPAGWEPCWVGKEALPGPSQPKTQTKSLETKS